MRRLLYIFLVASSSFLLSCSPTNNMMHLRPIAEESAYFDGKEVVKAEKDSIKIVASSDGYYDKYMVFDIEIFNNSEKPLLISPKNFIATSLDTLKNPLVNIEDSSYNVVTAIDPSDQLENTELAIQKQNQQLRTAKVVNTALVVGGLIALLAVSSNNHRPHSEATRRTIDIGETLIQAVSVKRIIDHTTYYSNIEKIQNEQSLWANEHFRKTTLYPHTSLRGRVFIKADKKADFIQLAYPTENNNFIYFLFKQSLGNH